MLPPVSCRLFVLLKKNYYESANIFSISFVSYIYEWVKYLDIFTPKLSTLLVAPKSLISIFDNPKGLSPYLFTLNVAPFSLDTLIFGNRLILDDLGLKSSLIAENYFSSSITNYGNVIPFLNIDEFPFLRESFASLDLVELILFSL